MSLYETFIARRIAEEERQTAEWRETKSFISVVKQALPDDLLWVIQRNVIITKEIEEVKRKHRIVIEDLEEYFTEISFE